MTSFPIVLTPADESAKHQLTNYPTLFLAGGIGQCYWRSQFIREMDQIKVTIFNPRVVTWPTQADALTRQLNWERSRLVESTLRCFWFTSSSDCPMTLLELGLTIGQGLPFVAGMESGYRLASNIASHCRLAQPQVEIASSLQQLAEQTKSCLDTHNTQTL